MVVIRLPLESAEVGSVGTDGSILLKILEEKDQEALDILRKLPCIALDLRLDSDFESHTRGGYPKIGYGARGHDAR